MAGFFRVPHSCCCCGSLKVTSVFIGIFYLLIALLGVAVSGRTESMFLGNSIYGTCEENLFMPLLRETSIVSGIVNLIMLYGAITSKSSFIAPWLAWNIPYPFVQLAHVIWTITVLANCDLIANDRSPEMQTTVITILTCNVVSLAFLLYFAVIIYSLYKDTQEQEGKNRSCGAGILIPSKNWDYELTPYTRYNPAAASPTNWKNLPSQSSNNRPAHKSQVQKPYSAGISRPLTSQHSRN